jgi:arabinofuranosyltransferase
MALPHVPAQRPPEGAGPLWRRPRVRAHVLLAVLILAFVVVVVRTAWICDDAYISLRTVDNVLGGHGLRWNADERVQTYTHPLWVLLLAVTVRLTGEFYLTTIVLGAALATAAVVLIATRIARGTFEAATAVLILLLSPAFVAYTTSGLENALSYLLVVLVLLAYWRAPATPQRATAVCFLAGLAVLNRFDLAFLLAPVVWVALRRESRRDALRAGLVGLAPVALWSLFALVYYGFVMPNTTYAKLATGLGPGYYLAHGLTYFRDAIVRESLTFFCVALVAVAALVLRRERALAIGILLYSAYLWWIGGDFMRGRFLTVPLVVAVAILARAQLLGQRRWRWAAVPVIVTLGFLAPYPNLTSGPRHGHDVDVSAFKKTYGIADERWYYFNEQGWLNGKPLDTKLGHDMRGLREQRQKEPSRLKVVQTAGKSGFMAGAGPHLVDRMALCDPLLARLGILPSTAWRIGHFNRELPSGYLASIVADSNQVESEAVRSLYDDLLVIVRGPLWSADRWSRMARLNLRLHDPRAAYGYAIVQPAELVQIRAAGDAWVWWETTLHFLQARDLVEAENGLRKLLAWPAPYAQGIGTPDYVMRSTMVARQQYDRGDREYAHQLMELLITLAPGRAEPRYLLGAWWVAEGDPVQGLQRLQQAADMGYAPARQALAALVARGGG